jgi:glutathione S-transferase
MIKVWGNERSSNVQKVLWCADELGVELELVRVGGEAGGHKDAEYLALNPNGQVPTLEDDGFILWESNAIMAYLIDRHGGGALVPPTPEARAIARRWMDWQLATLNAPSGRVMRATIRTLPEDQDAVEIAEASNALGALWQRFEDSFGAGPFVAGDFSAGDIPVGIHAERWFRFPIARPELPKTRAWYERLCERPAFQRHAMGTPMPGERV